MPRAYREAHPLELARREGERRHHADGELRDVAWRGGQRLLLLAPGFQVLRRSRDRAGSGPGLRRTKGLDAGRGREVARSEPRLRPGGESEQQRSYRGPPGREQVGRLGTGSGPWSEGLVSERT